MNVVMPGLEPGIPLGWALHVPDWDGRDKPGHDETRRRVP
jgi:hypothetical protein